MRFSQTSSIEVYNELQTLNDILDQNPSVEHSQSEILKEIVKSFQAESGQFCYHGHNNNEARKESTTLLNLTWKYTQQYIDYYHHIDPFVTIRPEIGAFRNNDIMPRPTWQGSEFFVDFIKPQKVSHLLVMRFRDEGEMVAHLGIFRPPSSPGFSSRDLFKAQYLSSLFSQNFRYQRIAQRSSELEKLLEQIKPIPSSGAVVLDFNLKMVYCNPNALEFGITPQYASSAKSLAEGYDTTLPQEILEVCRNIRRLIENNPWSRPDNRHLVLWGENFQRVDVDIIVLPVESNSSKYPSYFLILFNKVHHASAANNGPLPQNAGLTQKETEIARYICQGMTNKEIGNALFISLPTVATHVQHIFKKMGIRRRTELIRSQLQ